MVNIVDSTDLGDDDEGLLVGIVRVDVLDGGGHQLGGELGGQPDGKGHPPLQGGVGAGTVGVIIVIVTNLQNTEKGPQWEIEHCFGLFLAVCGTGPSSDGHGCPEILLNQPRLSC